MAIYHASTKPIARSAGRSAVAAAAYRAGVDLVDARTGLVHDYTRRGGVDLAEILTPDGLGVERNALWNAAELAEKRKDARTAREWILALPAELDAGQRRDLARDFAQALVARYGVAVDFAIHAPDREGDHRNHHAHLLTTTRQVSRAPDGGLVLGAKAHIELSDKARREQGLGAAADEVKAVRELWEHTANAALERAGVEARIDARSLQAQGIDREATQHLGPVASEMERRGKASDRGDGNRQVHINNKERARLSAEILDLQAEREARADAQRREAAEVERKESILRKAQARQQERDPFFDRMKIRGRWERRQKVRRNRQRDAEASTEQRPGIRHPDRPQWQVYRERMLTEAYNQDVAQTLGRWVRVERVEHGIHLHNREMDLTDYGDRIVAGLGGKEREIEAMLQLARAKGWQRLELTGSAGFQERAGAAALAAGFELADAALKERILDQQQRAAEARDAALRAQASTLGQWSHEHPRLAAAAKLAGRRLPGAPAINDWSPEAWAAADAWRVGRYGDPDEQQRLEKGGSTLQRACVADGLEAAYCAWAQQGLGLQIGANAPAPSAEGLVWTMKGEVTREDVDRFAKDINERKARSSVSHDLVVTFAIDILPHQRALVYEHLLRNDVAVQLPGKETRAEYKSAQKRLRTHHEDGREQQWSIDQRAREAAIKAREREEQQRLEAERQAIIEARREAEREAERREAERQKAAAEEQARREAEKRLEAERQKLREAARDLGREVGLKGKSEARRQKASDMDAEGRRLDVTDLTEPYRLGLAEGRKEAERKAEKQREQAVQNVQKRKIDRGGPEL